MLYYNLARKVFGDKSKQLNEVGNEFICYTSNFNFKEQEEKRGKFYELTSGSVMTQSALEDKLINGGIVNGKATFLPPPVYPFSARQRGARGVVLVNVVIDENGEVTDASSICEGDKDLQKASIEAALKAKFKPTLLKGEPVKVSGIITYVFN